MPALPDAAWFTLVPDWVCEVLSPSTAIVDRTGKQDIYREQGVPWLWFVDPAAHTIEVLSRAEAHWILAGSFGWFGMYFLLFARNFPIVAIQEIKEMIPLPRRRAAGGHH